MDPQLMPALNELVNNEIKYCGVLEVLNDLYLKVSPHNIYARRLDGGGWDWH